MIGNDGALIPVGIALDSLGSAVLGGGVAGFVAE
jgi:hypothetical protein